LDNISSLHQLTPQTKATEVTLFKPRDAYRTRVNPANLGPVIDYYLPSGPERRVIIEILDSQGTVLNSYNSDAPVLRAGRGNTGAGGAGTEPADPDVAPLRRAAPPPRVTKVAGLNRFAWDLRNQAGVTLPPGQYQVRLKFAALTFTQPLTVLIDPRVAADGVTLADLQEQFEHNMRLRELVTEVNQLVARVREAQRKSGVATDSAPPNAIDPGVLLPLLTRLVGEPVRYGKPGLQTQINYLAGMTANVDQKIGRDAVERYQVLKKELEELRVDVDRVLGPVVKSDQ
jgi:hypothetical protein